MSRRLELPAELWNRILASPELARQDLKAIRYVCRIWNNIIICILFNTLYIPWNPHRAFSGYSFGPRIQQQLKRSIGLLRHIASSPDFARHFKVISIDTDLCSQVDSYGRMPWESIPSWKSRIIAAITRKKRQELWQCIQHAIPRLISLQRLDIPWSRRGLCLQMKPIIASLPPIATLAVASVPYHFPSTALSQLRGLTTLKLNYRERPGDNKIIPIITNNPQLKKIDLSWQYGKIDLHTLFSSHLIATPACIESLALNGTLTVSDATSRFPHFRHLKSLEVTEVPQALWDILCRETVHLVRAHVRYVSIAFVRYMASYRGIKELRLAHWPVQCPADADSLWEAISLHKASLRMLELGERICTSSTIRHLRCLRSLKRLTLVIPDVLVPSEKDAALEEGDKIVKECLGHLEDWPMLEVIMFKHKAYAEWDSNNVRRTIKGQSFGDRRRLLIRYILRPYSISRRHESAYVMMRLRDGSFAFRTLMYERT